jgi:hypothetical protein
MKIDDWGSVIEDWRQQEIAEKEECKASVRSAPNISRWVIGIVKAIRRGEVSREQSSSYLALKLFGGSNKP